MILPMRTMFAGSNFMPLSVGSHDGGVERRANWTRPNQPPRFPSIPAIDCRRPFAKFPGRNVAEYDGLADTFDFQSIDVVALAESRRKVPPPFLLPILIRFGFAARLDAAQERRSAVFRSGVFRHPIRGIVLLPRKRAAANFGIENVRIFDPVNVAVVELFQLAKRHAKCAGEHTPFGTVQTFSVWYACTSRSDCSDTPENLPDPSTFQIPPLPCDGRAIEQASTSFCLVGDIISSKSALLHNGPRAQFRGDEPSGPGIAFGLD